MCEVRENSADNKIISFNIKNKKEHPFRELEKIIQDDPEYAWAVFCNICMPIYDSEVGLSIEDANYAAARVMQHIFNINITTQSFYGKKYRKL